MGICCPKQKLRSDLQLEVKVKGIIIQIVKGDILLQKIDAFVLGTDPYLKNRNSFQQTESQHKKIEKMYQNHWEIIKEEKENQPERNIIPQGQVTETTFQISKKSGFKSIISVSLPLWKGGQRQESQYLQQGIENALKQASSKYSSLAFTDIASTLFGFPKQEFAFVLSKCLQNYVEQNQKKKGKLKKISIVLRDDCTIKNVINSLIEDGLITLNDNNEEKINDNTKLIGNYAGYYFENDTNQLLKSKEEEECQYEKEKCFCPCVHTC